MAVLGTNKLKNRIERAGRTWKDAAVPVAAAAVVGAGFHLAPSGLNAEALCWSGAAALVTGFGRMWFLAGVEQRRAARERSDLMKLYHDTLRCLAAAIDARECHEREHVSLVEFVAAQVAEKMDLSREEVDGIRTAAVLMDVGTLGVPENILLQPGRPSVEEFAAIHSHTILGSQILDEVQFPWPVQQMIRSHHERWDGTGYPDGLLQDEIPLGARILGVADVYSALVSKRSYRKAWTHNQAVAHIRKMAGTQFDPVVVHTFLQMAYRIPQHGFGTSSFSEDVSSTIARANQQLVGLWEISQTASNSLSLEDTLNAIARKISDFFHCDACVVFLKTEQGVELKCRAVTPDSAAEFTSCSARMGDPGTGQVARDGHPVIIRPGRDCLVGTDGSVAQLDYDWAAIAPLGAGTSILGTINIYRRDREFTIEELDLLDALARHAAVPVANASLFEETRQCAERDPLTGLHNVRYLCGCVEQEFARARRVGGEFSIVAIDLDNFKSVNDHMGHQAGDSVLRDVAQILAGGVREYDSIVRYGGDEFVAVLSDAGAEAARESIERLERMVEEYVRQHPELAALGLGASFGAGTFPHDGRDMKSLLAEADARMYSSKRERHGALQAA